MPMQTARRRASPTSTAQELEDFRDRVLPILRERIRHFSDQNVATAVGGSTALLLHGVPLRRIPTDVDIIALQERSLRRVLQAAGDPGTPQPGGSRKATVTRVAFVRSNINIQFDLLVPRTMAMRAIPMRRPAAHRLVTATIESVSLVAGIPAVGIQAILAWKAIFASTDAKHLTDLRHLLSLPQVARDVDSHQLLELVSDNLGRHMAAYTALEQLIFPKSHWWSCYRP